MHWYGTIGTAALMAVVALGGCASKGSMSEPSQERVIHALEEPEPEPEPLPEAVAEDLLPPVADPLPEASAPEEPRFDLNVEQASAREFFMALVEGTDYNMVVHPEVQGEVSLTLQDVTIPEVMEIVRDVYGFNFEERPTGYLVLPARMRSRTFQLDYLNVSRSGHSDTTVSSGQLSGNGDSRDDDRSDERARNGDRDRQGSVTGSRISTDSSSEFWNELEQSLDSLVGDQDGRRVVVNPNTGVIVARAMPDELREIEAYLDTIQETAQRQVILEAKILEVELNEGFQAGINWGALARRAERTLTLGQIGGGSVFGEDSFSDIQGESGRLNPADRDMIDGTDTSAFGGVFTGAFTAGDFSAFVELLETQGDVTVLSSPRVSTVNNQKAVIKVGDDEFFVTDISTTTTTGAAATTIQPDVTLTPLFSGIALDVTPQVSGSGDVTLHINPSVSEVVEQVKNIGFGGLNGDGDSDSTFTVPLANTTIRESDSIIRAANGQLVVIGGLMQEMTREDHSQTPFLGDLPLVGPLFRHTQQSLVKSELVILLRPVVVDEEERMREAVRESRERFESLREESAGERGTVEIFGGDAEDGD